MAEQLVSHGAGFTRFGRDAEASADELGPLANLVGTWFGSRGWELIAVPATSGRKLSFKLIIRPYIEVITFEPIGAPVPDRGGPAGDLKLTGLKYEMRITDLETNEPLHLENGMWFYMPDQGHDIARSSAIPHGDCLLALGNASTTPGRPKLPKVTSLPQNAPPNPGYTEPYTSIPKSAPFQPQDVTGTLRKTLAKQHVVENTALFVTTAAEGGGILNIPFVMHNANVTSFTSTYWIETVRDRKTGEAYQQLQYFQQTDIDFLRFSKDDPLITWPHVNVNTLRKQ